jgi:hypothetical protein
MHQFKVVVPRIDRQEIEKIREEAIAHKEKAMTEFHAQMEDQRMKMDQERDRMEDQRKAMEEKIMILRDQNLDKLKDIKEAEIEILKDINGKQIRHYYKAPNIVWKSGEPMEIGENFKIDMPEIKSNFYAVYDERDVLDIENKLEGETHSADFPYEVKEGANRLTLNVNGSIDEGKVLITVKEPDGSVYNEYTLSPLANVVWKQTINLDDENGEKLTGKWTVTVATENARGTYKVHISGR